MKNLQFISSETLKRVTKKRTGEKKLHEVVQYLTDSNDFLERIADPKIEFVIFGIKEDIGVLANHGQPGARDTWDSVIKPLLNIQSNEHTNASTILILGHLDFTYLYETHSGVWWDHAGSRDPHHTPRRALSRTRGPRHAGLHRLRQL